MGQQRYFCKLWIARFLWKIFMKICLHGVVTRNEHNPKLAAVNTYKLQFKMFGGNTIDIEYILPSSLSQKYFTTKWLIYKGILI